MKRNLILVQATKSLFLAVGLLLIVSHSSMGRVLRVNSRTDLLVPLAGVNFYATFAEAYTSAAAGDTILLEVGSSDWDVVIAKKLYVVGTGKPPYHLKSITVNSGGEGTVLESISVTGNIVINANNIIARRLRTTGMSIGTSVTGGVNNITVEQCMVKSGQSAYPFLIQAQDVNILNSLILAYSGTNTAFSGNSPSNARILIKNNTISGSVNMINTVFFNNILYSGSFAVSNNLYSYNIGNATQFGTANGNQSNVSMATIFVSTGLDDNFYDLKPAPNAAIGTGKDGATCGHLGGAQPYIKGLYPTVPVIYDNTVAPIGTNTLQINFKAKTY